MERELFAARMPAERVAAVEGMSVPPELADYFRVKQDGAPSLSPGEVGCYASHLKVARRVLDEGLDYALVLEDDAILPVTLRGDLDEILSSVPHGWDIVHLSNNPTRAFRPLKEMRGHRKIVSYSRVPAGAIGYLISSRGAEKLLAPRVCTWPIDTDFRQPWEFGLSIYGVVPKLIAHNDALKSVLLEYGERSRRRRGIRRPTLRHPLGNPLHTPQGAWFNIRSLGPSWWALCLLQNIGGRLARAVRGRIAADKSPAMLGQSSVVGTR